MQSKIFYRSSTGRDYELDVEHEEGVDVPKFLSEDYKGEIQCLTTDRNWPSLIHMSQDLKMEIVSWGSDIGD